MSEIFNESAWMIYHVVLLGSQKTNKQGWNNYKGGEPTYMQENKKR